MPHASRQLRGVLAAVLLLLACGCPRAPQSASLKGPFLLVDGPEERLCVAFAALSPAEQAAVAKFDPDRLAEVLAVRVADAPEDVPDMAGAVTLTDGNLRFQPRYPFTPGTRYRAVLHRARIPGGDSATNDVTHEFAVAQPAADAPTVVSGVYPSAGKLPENLLKFYIHFSAPMSRGEAYQRIHLLDADGSNVAAPFLELGEELWDPRLRRFTLLFDPGRIKRGLKPREEVGPVLEEGKRYTLVIDADWQDAKGRPLAARYSRSFDVLPPDDAPIDTSSWKIDPPQAGSHDPLVVRFPEPLDHSLLARVVHVADASGKRAAGSIEITDGETCWRFTPDDPWTAGPWQVVADTTLEDLAGNSIGRAFDVDVFAPIENQITTETISLPFTISGP